MTQDHHSSHSQWSSKIGFLMAAVGSAVGLGSIWKFPYMTGEFGGSAFVILFIVSITLIGFPVLVAEWMIGRRGQSNPIDSFQKVAVQENASQGWRWLGGLGVLASFLILSFYSVIGGWALNYIAKTGTNTFHGMDGKATEAVFNAMLASPSELTIWHTGFMILTALIVAGGVSGGIERASKWLMPALAVIMVVIVGYNLFNAEFAKGFWYLFDFNFAKMQEVGVGKVLIAALGHAFFCLSLGMGIMVAYGSYLKSDVNLLSTARTVIVWDVIFSLMAGLAIFPIIFSNGLDPAGGPGLVFVSLPIAFGKMSVGLVVGTLFFMLLTFAALTSSISLLEPIVALLEEKTSLNRMPSTIIAAVATWLLGIAALLSFNVWGDITILPKMNIFDSLDYATSRIMLPLVGLGTMILVAWRMNQPNIKAELGLSDSQWSIWQITTKYIAPIGIVAVFIAQIVGYGA
ncbi:MULTISPECIES: sodium-dependent transporter [unclassified Moraxella]|uniref:sodium-dependent transporter n=1 Tax=unclassified Moraxella TaxID=2685852 RepID=UPI003AF50852